MKAPKKNIYQKITVRINELFFGKKEDHLIEENYRRLFDNSTISIWNEDFTLIYKQLDELRKLNISDIKSYLNQNPEVIFSLLSNLKINSVNKATLKLFKAKSSDEFINNVQSTFGEGADIVFLNLIEAIWNNEESFTSEVNYKTLKGQEFPALFSMYIPQTITEQKSVPVSIQCIRNIKAAESVKKDSLIKLEQAQKLGKIGSWEWNIETDKALWSDEMYRIYGVKKGEFEPTSENVGKTILEEDRHKMVNAIGQLLKGEIVESFEFKITRPNNEIRFLNIVALDLNDGTVFGVTQDITNRKQIENKLNEAQKLAKVGSWLSYPS